MARVAGASALLIVAVGAGGTPARAETVKTFTATATIVSGCSIISGTDGGNWGSIDFGTTGGLGAQALPGTLVTTAGASIALDCTPGLAVSVSADQGTHAVAGARQLANGSVAAALVPYLLYADGSATAWTTQAIPLSFTAGVVRRTLPVRAVANLSGPTPAGTYTDMVRITVSW